MILEEAKQELCRVRDSALDAIEPASNPRTTRSALLEQLDGATSKSGPKPDADALMQRLERVAARINAGILAASLRHRTLQSHAVRPPHGWH